MKNVFFYPYIGKNYETKGFNGVKLLILGESHYCEHFKECEVCGKQSNNKCKEPNFTKDVLKRYLNYKKGDDEFEDWMRTFTRFTNVLLEEQLDNETLINFWDSVIFYNYVQSSTEGPRKALPNQQFEESKDAFIEVLEEYKPDLILVWGQRLWDKLDNGRVGKEIIIDDKNGNFYYYKISNKEIPAYSIYHPSSSCFSYEYSKYLKEAIRLVSKT